MAKGTAHNFKEMWFCGRKKKNASGKSAKCGPDKEDQAQNKKQCEACLQFQVNGLC